MKIRVLISVNGGGGKHSLNKEVTISDCKKGGRI